MAAGQVCDELEIDLHWADTGRVQHPTDGGGDRAAHQPNDVTRVWHLCQFTNRIFSGFDEWISRQRCAIVLTAASDGENKDEEKTS